MEGDKDGTQESQVWLLHTGMEYCMLYALSLLLLQHFVDQLDMSICPVEVMMKEFPGKKVVQVVY